jgi:flagellar FliL protein
MADAAAAENEKVRVAAPAPPLPIKLIIIIVVATLVAGVGGTFAFIKLAGGGPKETDRAEEQKSEATATPDSHRESGGKQAPGAMFDVEPFIVNLADSPEIRYLKITIKLEVNNEAVAAELAARVAQIRDTILVLLSSKDVNTVMTPQGKFQLRDEIMQRVNGLLSRPGIRAAYFTDFVVQ